MVKVGKWIAKHRILMLIIGVLLIIPSVIGIAKTKVNYDLLSYLPDHLETVKGQDILVDEFGMGAFSMVAVENMDMKDVQKLEKEFEKVPHVQDVLWYDDVADISLPTEMIPKDIRKAFINGDATMMLVLFDDTTSSDNSMEALTQLRKIANKQCFISGMTGIVTDIKNIAMKELPIYVVIAALLSLVVLEITSGSFVVPFLFLLSIGLAILYNLGSNIILGETSYITQALTAVLQLGVTMDYSIFLLNSYEENKKRFPGEKDRAMGHAIANTFKSVVGSSVTTVAGFIALCVMTFALGRDLGIVMAKGVVIGVICSNAALAFLYISGNAITVAAMIQPAQVCTTLMPNCSYSRIPNGRLLLNRRSRKNPAAVGGSTIGSVRIPSAIAFTFGPALITLLAANRPRKNENIVATIPVFNDTYSGL